MENSGDRVRSSTPAHVNDQIDDDIDAAVSDVASLGPEAITARIHQLDREWDIERRLEVIAAGAALSGVALASFHRRGWLLLPAVMLGFLMQHAVQGWCAPAAVMRRRGVRTRQEIDRERYALKALRGDFEGLSVGSEPWEAMEAVEG
jgi:hypothetical protein